MSQYVIPNFTTTKQKLDLGLCKYKDMFGEPKKGVHSYRFLNLAVADVMLTILGAALISYIGKYPFCIVLGCLFLLGIICHRLFCVRTTVDKFLFPNI